MKIQNRDIVVVGIQAWDLTIGSNAKNIASEFARDNRVLYVNMPMDRNSRRAEKGTEKMLKRENVLKGLEPDLEMVDKNLWVLNPRTVLESINKIPVKAIYNYLNRRNARRFSEKILDALKRLDFGNYLLFNDSSMFLGVYLKEMLRPDKYIYYIRDNLTKNPYWAKHGKRLEPVTIRQADVVVTNSIYYANYAKHFNQHSYMVGQGCDVTLFNDEKNDIPVAETLKTIPSPIIGYVGYLTSRRLDIEIIAHIAAEKPGYSVVLVGPEDDVFKESPLHQMKNVYFLGSQPPETLPTFIKGFDLCINPQIVNDATIGNYPRKIDEYLAMGKPTLATWTEAMEYFKDYTYLGKNKEDYISLINKALAEDSPELQKSRREFALNHSWETNVLEIGKALAKLA
ncbi:MAG TPA: glycosyltransferase [Bacteroidales bacterium]|nr:glycosyltransferase [Bacteroidales bacterium]HPR58758.1 glycosyltransferase [Bacteroidales bacterium]HRW97692.1 glycosyltransferase [Bacteroidales bacterium]